MHKPNKDTQIAIIDAHTVDGQWAMGMRLLADALRDPDTKSIMDRACADERMVRRELFSAAFMMGVATLMTAIASGKVQTMTIDKTAN